MSKFVKTNEKIEAAVTGSYRKIEDTVTGGYKKVEDTFVGSYKKVEDQFIKTFLARDGETVEAARHRVTGRSGDKA